MSGGWNATKHEPVLMTQGLLLSVLLLVLIHLVLDLAEVQVKGALLVVGVPGPHALGPAVVHGVHLAQFPVVPEFVVVKLQFLLEVDPHFAEVQVAVGVVELDGGLAGLMGLEAVLIEGNINLGLPLVHTAPS